MLEEEGGGGGWCTGVPGSEGAGRRGLWRRVQRHARRRGGGWCTGVPGSEGQGGGGCGGRCSAMLEEEGGGDGVQGYQAVRGREEGAVEECAAPC